VLRTAKSKNSAGREFVGKCHCYNRTGSYKSHKDVYFEVKCTEETRFFMTVVLAALCTTSLLEQSLLPKQGAVSVFNIHKLCF
jgi:hypothetical protein